MTEARPFYGEFGWAYDLLVDDPIEPWVEAVEAALANHSRPHPAHVLDAGAGTGRHAAELARRGHAVTLVDASRSLLEQARRRLPSGTIVHGDLRTVVLEHRFDAVACRGVLNDICEDELRTEILTRFAEHLCDGGVAVLDVRDLHATEARYRGGRTARRVIATSAGDLVYESTGWIDGELLRIRERHELRDPAKTAIAEHEFAMRPWTREELLCRLGDAGFDDVEIRAGAGRETSDRLLAVAARR